MKKLILLLFLFMAMGISGCDEKKDDFQNISVTDFYILDCGWSINKESPYGQIQEKVYILGSEDNLSNYYICLAIAREGQRIDFEKNSLIAVWSMSAKNELIGDPTTRYVKQIGKNSYEWSIDISLSNNPPKYDGFWFRSAIIPKISKKSKFKLVINYQ
jgi:hypothetical protein